MTRRRRILISLASVPLLLVLALGWLLGTASGLRFALARAEQATDGALTVQQAHGRLAGTLLLDGLRFHATGGPDVRAARVQLRLGAWALLRGRVHVEDLQVNSLDVDLPAQSAASPKASTPFDPRAPLYLAFDRIVVEGLRVHRAKHDLFVAERVELAGAWTRDGVEVSPLRVRAPDGNLELDARLAFMAGHPGNAAARFDWRAGGRRWSGELKARSNGRSASASLALTHPSTTRAELTLSTRAPYAWTAKVSLPRGAARAWLGSGTGIGQLAATLDAHGDMRNVHAKGALDLDATHVQLAALDARLAAGGKQVRLDKLQLRSPQHAGTLDASGTVDLAQAAPSAQLRLAWSGVTIPATLAGRALASEGTLDLDGGLQRYRATLDARAGPPGSLSKIRAQVLGTPGQLQVEQLALQQAKGRLELHGELRYGTRMQWQLAATATEFDPAPLLPGWSGALNGKLSSRGQLGKDGSAQLKLDALSGTLRGQRVGGRGQLALSPLHVLSGKLDLRYGSGRLVLSGARGARNDLDLKLGIGALGDLSMDARGAATADVRIRGTWPRLALRGNLDGRQLAWRTQQAGELAVRFELPDVRRPCGRLRLTASKLHAYGFAFDKLQVDAHGDARAHALTLDASGKPLSVRLELDGGTKGTAWNGRLSRLDLKLAGQPDWRLEAPAALAWNRGTASLGQACLTAGDPRLCLAAGLTRGGALHASYRMHGLPLELVLALAGNDLPMRARGTLDGAGDLRRSAAGALSGKAQLTSSGGAVSYLDHPQQVLLDYRDFDARLDLAPAAQHLRVTATLQKNGSLDGKVNVQGPRQVLDGHLRVRLDNLRFVELFTAEVANLKGHLDADLALAGTLGKPSLNGTATAAGLSGELPALGLKLDQGQLRVSGNQASALRIEGRVHSGKGTLEISGSAGLGSGQATRLTLRGRQVQVADLPSATVSLSPDVRVQGNARGLRIDGQVRVGRADVNLEKLPGGGATQASPDVVVVDAAKSPPPRHAPLALTTELGVDLGEHTHVTGYGLDGNLQGKLNVTTHPGKQPVGQGQIRIAGTFSAYGQNLDITRGRLLFASSPLDNPGLDIRAVRKLNPNATIADGQEVGLEVRGTARRPVLTVFSNPVMEQSDALSYLITGKPLSQVKSGEGNMVNSAAQALGSATGDLLAKSVGSRLGISEIGVSSNDTLGTTAFTVGKYLSPRLYLSYGVGLFQPGQVVTLRYILSRRWNFEAQQATESSRASLNYRYEH